MKIAALADMHGKSISKIARKLEFEDLDVIMVNGDIGGCSDDSFEKVLGPLCRLDVPVLIKAGNMDNGNTFNDTMRKLMKKYHNLVNMEVRGYFDLLDVEVISSDRLLKNSFHSPQIRITKFLGEGYESLGIPMIVQSHEPPYGYCDATCRDLFYFCRKMFDNEQDSSVTYDPDNCNLALNFNHVGNKELTKAIHRYKPTAVVFGHIHENNSLAPPAMEIGTGKPIKPGEIVKSLALNCGPASDGYYALLNVGRDGSVSYEMKGKIFCLW